MIEKKYFTLEEARTILPEVKAKLKKLITCYIKLRVNDGILISYDDEFENTHEEISKSLMIHEIHADFFRVLKELLEMGIYVKDPGIGLVDFYSKFNKEDIFLCYQYPENDIEYWHTLENGYNSRKHVDLLKLKGKV